MSRLRAVLVWFRRTFIYDELADVRDFCRRFGMLEFHAPGHLSLHLLSELCDHLQEELDELRAACERQDLAEQADALVDLVWIAKKVALGLGLPWHLHWLEVRRANDERVRGISKRGHAVDVVKPPGWEPPCHEGALAICGYREEAWKGEPSGTDVNGNEVYPPHCLPGRARSYEACS